MSDQKGLRALIDEMRHLVSLNEPKNGGPYQGFAAERCMAAMTRAADALSALQAAQPGWRMVPVEPTEAMYAAAEREWDGRMSARSRGVWQAMLAAAPSAEEGEL